MKNVIRPVKLPVALLLALVWILLFSVPAFAALPEPTKEFFVNDFAKVLNVSDKNEMQQQAERLQAACGAQVVVATVENLGGQALEEYSIALARQWKIGDREKNNGVLLLLTVSERQVRIEVGSGLEGALNDAKTGRILDRYGMDYFKQDDFSTGLREVFLALTAEVYHEYGLEENQDHLVGNTAQINGEDLDEDLDSDDAMAVIIFFASMLGTGLYVLLVIFRSRGGRGGGGFYGGHGGGIFFGGPGGFSGGGRGGFSGGGFSGGGGGFSGGGSSRGF